MEKTHLDCKIAESQRIMRDMAKDQPIVIMWSGGRDSHSLVQLYEEMAEPKPPLEILTVNTGDWPEETKQRLENLSLKYKVTVVHSDARKQREACGDPFDVVVQNEMSDLTAEQTPFACCWNNIMQPMHKFMTVDYTYARACRGVKAVDNVPQSAPQQLGPEYCIINPLWDWTDEDVQAYLKDMPTFYLLGAKSGVDCVTCTAYMKHNNRIYMQQYYPEEYAATVIRVREHTRKVKDLLGNYPAEFTEGTGDERH
jgi:3'-phosphoadenosine 5'-phosphosulfate sulfotransferase (PAPS reductase)/FAD synthetase